MNATTSSPESLFREHQRFLWGLAYRMTGSAADADDVVQETFARAVATPPSRTDEPWRPWLTKVALNLARDVLRRRKREAYDGPWLPSPVETARFDDEPSPDVKYERVESVSFAFLLALETLSPRERAVLLLRDVFDYSVRDAADLLETSEANIKTTHHRARRALSGYDETRATRGDDAEALARTALQKFLQAIAMHDGAALEATLAASARAISDAGGEFLAARKLVLGAARVAKLFLGTTRRLGSAERGELRDLNGAPAFVAELPRPKPRSAPRLVLSCDVDMAGRITTIYCVFASRKLVAV